MIDDQIRCLTTLGRTKHCLEYTRTATDGVALMRRKKVGSVIVTKNRDLFGIVTERDLVRDSRNISKRFSLETTYYGKRESYRRRSSTINDKEQNL